MEVQAAKMIAAGILAFGMMGAALGIGMVFSALLQGIARNPATQKTLTVYAFIGAALAELMGLAAIGIAAVFAFS